MMKPALLLLAALSSAVAPQEPVYLGAEARSAMLAEVEEGMSKVRGVAATFEQDKQLSLFDENVHTEGLILFQNPDLLRWEINKPFHSVLIIARDDAAKFEVIDGQFRALDLGRGKDALLFVMTEIRDWFRGKFERTTENFDLQVAREPRPLIRLTPKQMRKGQSLAAIELLISKEMNSIDQVTIHERNGDKTTMRFKQLANFKGADLDLGYFATKTPLALEPAKLKTVAGN